MRISRKLCAGVLTRLAGIGIACVQAQTVARASISLAAAARLKVLEEK